MRKHSFHLKKIHTQWWDCFSVFNSGNYKYRVFFTWRTDTRIMLHAKDAVIQDLSSILLKATDTDIVVVCLSLFTKTGAENIWSSTGHLTTLTWWLFMRSRKFDYNNTNDIWTIPAEILLKCVIVFPKNWNNCVTQFHRYFFLNNLVGFLLPRIYRQFSRISAFVKTWFSVKH